MVCYIYKTIHGETILKFYIRHDMCKSHLDPEVFKITL